MVFMEVASRLVQTPSSSRSPGTGGTDWIGAVREDHVVGGVAHAVDLDDTRTGEPASAAQQVDAVIGQPALLSGIGVVRDHEVTPGKRRLDIDLGARGRLARPVDRLARP
jgi:hypothetical protein